MFDRAFPVSRFFEKTRAAINTSITKPKRAAQENQDAQEMGRIGNSIPPRRGDRLNGGIPLQRPDGERGNKKMVVVSANRERRNSRSAESGLAQKRN